MQIHIRLSGELIKNIGSPRLTLTLAEGATVSDLRDQLCQQYPSSASTFQAAVPIISGRHVTPAEQLYNGQEVAFLMPIAGG